MLETVKLTAASPDSEYRWARDWDTASGEMADLLALRDGCITRAQHLLDEVANGYLSMEMTFKEFDDLVEQIDAIETEIDDLRRQR